MRVLITLSQFLLGGTETYSVTVAEQLERLGHSTLIHAPTATGPGCELVASRGLRLAVGDLSSALEALGEVDAVLAQDSASAYELAGREDGVRQVFVAHGLASFEHPPVALRPAPRVVVLNDRIGARVAALATAPEAVRLRQPIDIERYRPRGASSRRARRVLVFSNYVETDRLQLLEGACADLGLELTRVGAQKEPKVDAQQAIADADIVVGYGRSVLEAMAMGRAAYVWDRGGGDGWVTPESYPALEADGFSGAATDTVIDADRLRADFAAYRPELGTLGFDLVRAHHSAAKHTEALVQLLRRAEIPTSGGDDPEALALLVRAETRASRLAAGFEYEAKVLRKQLDALQETIDVAQREVAVAREAESAERTRRAAAEDLLGTVLRSRSWRLTGPLRRAGTRLRASIRRRR